MIVRVMNGTMESSVLRHLCLHYKATDVMGKGILVLYIVQKSFFGE